MRQLLSQGNSAKLAAGRQPTAWWQCPSAGCRAAAARLSVQMTQALMEDAGPAPAAHSHSTRNHQPVPGQQHNDTCTAHASSMAAAAADAMARTAGTNADTDRQEEHSAEVLWVDPNSLPSPSPPDPQQPMAHLHYSLPSLHTDGMHTNTSSSSSSNGNSSMRGSTESALLVLQRAAQLLREGAPVAMPTETVYGLAANALSAEAVAGVFAAKGRPSDNPLIVHVSDIDMLRALYPGNEANALPEVYQAAVQRHWPGPLTILLPASPLVPPSVTCGQPTLAVRMPSHPVARALIAACGFPLAAPSANTSGRPSPTTAAHVVQDLGFRIPMVIDGGPCDCGIESTVLDALRHPPVVLRPGGVTAEQLASLPGLEALRVFGGAQGSGSQGVRSKEDAALLEAPTAPGMKYRHYSPRAPVVLVEVGSSCAAAVRAVADAEVARLQGGDAQARIGVLRTTEASTSHPCNGTSSIASATSAGAGSSPANNTSNGCQGSISAAQAAASSELGWVGHAPDGSSGPGVWEYRLGRLEAPSTVARELFAALRAMDDAGMSIIVCEGVVEAEEGVAVMNRLRKAAAATVQAGTSSHNAKQ